ncbi:MAG: hypothetical protein ACP5E4_01400, partial [Candidatus Aenigmatarchaeota archaeon]
IMLGRKKGVAYSVIAVVALVGVLGVLGGMSYQSSIGSGVVQSTEEKYDQDLSTQRLEFAKAMLLQDVRFSTLNGVLAITKNGGTTDPETFWLCNNVPQPVTRAEFSAAISNVSLDYMGAYIQSLEKEKFLIEKDITVSDCECISVALHPAETCTHLNGDFLGSGLTDELITVSEPALTTYKGPLNVNDVGPVRAAWFQKVLEDEFEDNHILQIISTSMAANCPEDVQTKYEIAYEDLCAYLKKELDPDNPEYIICEITEVPAPHSDCTRIKKEETCFSGISLQGSDKAILIHLEDLKYEPLGDETRMEWNIKAAFTLDEPECTPINY